MADIDRAMKLAESDAAFRANVLESPAAALTAYQLSEQEREQLQRHIAGIERRLEDDPNAITEADHGQADAAAPKN